MFKKLFIILTLAAPTLANATTLEEDREQIEKLFFRTVISVETAEYPPKEDEEDAFQRLTTELLQKKQRYATAYAEHCKQQTRDQLIASCSYYFLYGQHDMTRIKELFDTYAQQPPAIICSLIFQDWLESNHTDLSPLDLLSYITTCVKIRRSTHEGQAPIDLSMSVIRMHLQQRLQRTIQNNLVRAGSPFKEMPSLTWNCHLQGRHK